MKLTTVILLVVAVAISLLSVDAPCQVVSDSAAVIVQSSPPDVTLKGTIHYGYIQYAGRHKPTRYIYLHLNRPVDVIGSAQVGDFFHVYDVQLLAASRNVKNKLEGRIGSATEVIGKIPMPPGSGAYQTPFGLAIRVDRVSRPR